MQGSNGSVPGPGVAVDVVDVEVDLVGLIDSVVAVVEDMRPLRLECARLMTRHAAGVLSEPERQRYCTARLALLLRESAARRARFPRSAETVLRRRSELLVEAMLAPAVPVG